MPSLSHQLSPLPPPITVSLGVLTEHPALWHVSPTPLFMGIFYFVYIETGALAGGVVGPDVNLPFSLLVQQEAEKLLGGA